MMKRLVLIALGIVTFSPAFAVNILANPGFESGVLDPWFNDRDFGGISPWATSTDNPHSGAFDATCTGNIEIRQNFSGVLTSDITEVSFWIRHPDGSDPAAYDLFYSDGSSQEFVANTTTREWEHFDVTSNLAGGKTLVGMSIWGFLGGGSQVTFVDDATVNVVPEPVSIMALGAGLAAFLRRRRK